MIDWFHQALVASHWMKVHSGQPLIYMDLNSQIQLLETIVPI